MSSNRRQDISKLYPSKELAEVLTSVSDIWFTMTFKNDVRIYQKLVELHEEFVNRWKAEVSDPDFVTQCMFQSIATGFSQHSVAKGGNVLGLDAQKDNVVMLLYNIAVKSPELEALARKKLMASGEVMKQYAASLDGLVDWTYLNYADGTQVRCSIPATYQV